MSTAFEIPLKPSTPQRLSVSILGVSYNLSLWWNDMNSDNDNSGTWQLDISDVNNDMLIGGIPLITGADLLEQYSWMNFGFQLIVQTDHDVNETPAWDTLGTTSHLYAVTP